MKEIKTVTFEDAKKAIKAMEKEAEKLEIGLSFCIVDSMYNILIHEKMDNARVPSVNVSKAKAMTSLKLGIKTSGIKAVLKKFDISILDLAGNCETSIPGGFPLYEVRIPNIHQGP